MMRGSSDIIVREARGTDMPEAGRQVIYGLVIILMLLAYGRGERVTS